MEPPADASPSPSPPPPRPPEDAYRCHRCGAPHDPYQEYCLECGARLARYYPRGSWISRREMWTAQSPLWFWLMLLALLALVLVGGAIVLAATDDDATRSRQAAATGRQTTSVLQVPTEITTETFPTITTAPTATATVPTLPTTTTAPTTTGRETDGGANGGTGTIIAWPAAKEGYTVVLASVPTSRGRAAAETKAEQAINDGLSQVGILNSSNYGSLKRGYYVVFTGVHDTLAQAQSALPGVRAKNYPLAYVREIAA